MFKLIIDYNPRSISGQQQISQALTLRKLTDRC